MSTQILRWIDTVFTVSLERDVFTIALLRIMSIVTQ